MLVIDLGFAVVAFVFGLLLLDCCLRVGGTIVLVCLFSLVLILLFWCFSLVDLISGLIVVSIFLLFGCVYY